MGEQSIDASGFTILPLFSGAIVLLAILNIRRKRNVPTTRGSWSSGLMLFVYAATFSYAYVTLKTGTDSLILFRAVELTMIQLSFISGAKVHVTEKARVSLAFIGFVYLVLPGVTPPSIRGFVLMPLAGIAWGIYTLREQRSVNPIEGTAYNFSRTISLVNILAFATFSNTHLSAEGILLAILSGAIASGIGCTIWYIALRGAFYHSDCRGSIAGSGYCSYRRDTLCFGGNHHLAGYSRCYHTWRNFIGSFRQILFCSAQGGMVNCIRFPIDCSFITVHQAKY